MPPTGTPRARNATFTELSVPVPPFPTQCPIARDLSQTIGHPGRNCQPTPSRPNHEADYRHCPPVEANQGYAAARANVADRRPGRQLAVVTCMDARIDVFAALGLHLGEALVIRNAGGRVTDDVLRSLALATHVLGVDTVVVMQHTKCGLAGVTDEELRRLTGADFGFLPIADHAPPSKGHRALDVTSRT